MAYNGDGTFSLPYNWVNDSNNGIAITASRMDTQFNNCVTGFDTVICRDGQSTITNDIPWGGFRLTGLGAATTAGDALSYGGAAVLGATVITSTSANAFDVGPNGATNPTLQIDASTSSAATGLKLKAAAAASGFALSVLSSGTDESLSIDAKGAGTIILNGTATGAVSIPGSQIKFPTANTNASSNVNTLDNYQEGTITFSDSSGQSITIGNFDCVYQLVGNQCNVQGTVTYAGSGNPGVTQLTGLPFPVLNVSGLGGAFSVYGANNVFGILKIGTSDLNFVAAAGGSFNNSSAQTAGTLRFQFSYRIA